MLFLKDKNYIYNQNIPQFIIPPNPIVYLNVNTNNQIKQ